MRKFILLSLWLPLHISLLAFSVIALISHQPRTRVSLPNYAYAQELMQVTPSPVPVPTNISPKTDIRITVLRKFLQSYSSPLTDLSEYLVRQADLQGLDYALIPAISMQESGGCKIIPENSHNCWGFGIYGATMTKFPSYEQAIAQVAKTIKESYIKNGLVNPTLLENIWAPQSTGQWSYAVNYFIGKIRDLERNTPAT